MCGGFGGPNDASDGFSGTMGMSAPARRRKSFSDTRRDSTPWPEIGNAEPSSDMDA
jgi:hypothetical protein